MKKMICFATGNLWRWSRKRAKIFDIAKQFDFEGIEFTFVNEKELAKFEIRDKDFISNLDYVSIHSPFYYHTLSSKTQKKAIVDLETVYSKINASNVVFHPVKIDHYDVLMKNMLVSIENLTPRIDMNNEIFKKILDVNPGLGVTLDVNHAMVKSEDEINVLVKMFKDRITQMHCSAYIDEVEHQPLHLAGEEYWDKIKIIKKLKVPLVLEADFPKGEIDMVKKELEFLKSWY